MEKLRPLFQLLREFNFKAPILVFVLQTAPEILAKLCTNLTDCIIVPQKHFAEQNSTFNGTLSQCVWNVE